MKVASFLTEYAVIDRIIRHHVAVRKANALRGHQIFPLRPDRGSSRTNGRREDAPWIEELDLGYIASVTQGKGLRELWEELLEGLTRTRPSA
jgi:hypothetical protein